MRQQSQIIADVATVAANELEALGLSWDTNYVCLIHHAVRGTDCDAVAEVPWELLRILVTHTEIRQHIHPSGLRLSNAKITSNKKDKIPEHGDVYDFFLCEATVPLSFINCRMDGRLSLEFARLKSLSLFGSTMRSVHLDAAQVEGAIIFDRCFFNMPAGLSIKADELRTGGRVSLRECVAMGGVRLARSHIGGDLDASGAFMVSTTYGRYFWGHVNIIGHGCVGCFRECDIFTAAKPSGEPISEDIIRVVLPFHDGKTASMRPPYEPMAPWFKALDLYDAVITGNVKLRRGFRALGEVTLNAAQISSAVLARGALFCQPDGVALSMDGASIRLGTYMQKGDDKDPTQRKPFIAHGSVSMRGATVSQRLVCGDAYFQTSRNEEEVRTLLSKPMREREAYALFAKRLRVGGDLILNKALAEGGNEPGALGSLVSLENASVGGRLFFLGTPIGMMYNGAEEMPPFLNLDFAQIAGSANLAIASSSSLRLESCRISVRSARVGRLDISECNHDHVRWDLEGLTYSAVDKYAKCKVNDDAAAGIEVWITRILSDSIQPYDQFISFLKQTGDEHGAWRVGVAKEKVITGRTGSKHTQVNALSALRLSLQKLVEHVSIRLYHLWRHLIGPVTVNYGYNPVPAFIWLVILWMCGVLVFSMASGRVSDDVCVIFPTKAGYYNSTQASKLYKCKDGGDGRFALKHYPTFNPWWYSLELATPIPSRGQQEHWGIEEGHGVWGAVIEGYKRVHTIIGWFLSFLIVLSPTRLLRRD